MSTLKKRHTAFYVFLLALGLGFAFLATAGALGTVFAWLSIVSALCLVGVSAMGLWNKQSPSKLPAPARVALGLGAVAALVFAVLMAFIIIALRSFA